VDISVTVCVFVCTVTDFSAEDKASGVNVARRFIGVQGRESPIFVNFAPTEAQNRTNPCGPRTSQFVRYRCDVRRISRGVWT